MAQYIATADTVTAPGSTDVVMWLYAVFRVDRDGRTASVVDAGYAETEPGVDRAVVEAVTDDKAHDETISFIEEDRTDGRR